MTTNLERFEKDLDNLINTGDLLEASMMREVSGNDFIEQVNKHLKKEKAEAYLKSLPDFKEVYEEWYSESLAVLKQILPDRISHFSGLYEKPKTRKSVEYGNYVIQDYMQGLTVTYGATTKVDVSAAIPQFRQQLAITKAAKKRFKSSLFDIKQLVQADLFDSEIETTRELLKNKFLRAAGAVAGVILEKHLIQVCENHTIKIAKKNPGISDLNELLKTNSIIEIPEWRHISMLADIRNLCDHNKKKEPKTEQVEDLINGVEKVLKTVF